MFKKKIPMNVWTCPYQNTPLITAYIKTGGDNVMIDQYILAGEW